MLNNIVKIANKLDSLGLTKEADVLDKVLAKYAQVATTGVAGATYESGRQMGPGTSGGRVIKFYKAKPKTITEFNKFLAGLIQDFSKDKFQIVFSRNIISKAAELAAQTTWSPLTEQAFKAYTKAVGLPEAGENWQAYAKKNNYEPTMYGVYAFWEDTIDKAMRLGRDLIESATYIGEKEEGALADYSDKEQSTTPVGVRGPSPDVMAPPTGGPQTDYDEMKRYLDEMEKKPSSSGKSGTLKGRVYAKLGAGSGFTVGSGGVDTYTDAILREIAAVTTPEAKAWFSQDPKIVIPDEFGKYSDKMDIKSWAASNGDAKVFNQEVEAVYMRIADIAVQADKVRQKTRERMSPLNYTR